MTSGGDVLVLRALGLGDFLSSVPALRALRAHFRGRRIVLAAPAHIASPLLELAGLDLDVVDHRRLDPIAASGEPPAVAVNLHGKGPESHRILAETGAPRIIAFHRPELGIVGPPWEEEEHETVRWCRLLAEAGIAGDETDLHISAPYRATLSPLRGATVIHPGAKDGARRWPADRFASLARHEADEGRTVLITGSRGETGLARAVAAQARLSTDSVLAGQTDLHALTGVIAAAGMVVCGDTGVAHLATALATPSVLLFGPTSPAKWGPRAGPHAVLWRGSTGDPHAAAPDPGVLEIRVPEVISAMERLRDGEETETFA